MDSTVPTVFVVDDDVNVQRALARLLRSHAMQVQTFASAHEFLRCPRPDGLACLVLDVRLAGEDGLRVQDALQTAAWRPPIIFLTGYGTVPLCVRAMRGGAIDFLQKPIDAEALLAAIATALEQDARTRDSQCHHAELQQRVATLTPRERDVMGLVTTGLLNKEIASALGTSEKTIKAHRAHVMQKMQARSLAALVRMVAMVETSEPQTAQPQPIASAGYCLASQADPPACAPQPSEEHGRGFLVYFVQHDVPHRALMLLKRYDDALLASSPSCG